MTGRETEAGQPRRGLEESNASCQTFRACGHSCTSFDTELQTQGPMHAWILAPICKSFTGLRPQWKTPAAESHTHAKGQPPRAAGANPAEGSNSKTANTGEEDLVSTWDISVMILQWPALLSRQSPAGLDQMGLFRVWSWFLLMEIIMPGCLKCMDCCGGQDKTQTPNQKQMETFIIVALLHSQSGGGLKGLNARRWQHPSAVGDVTEQASYLEHTLLFRQEMKLSFCPPLL